MIRSFRHKGLRRLYEKGDPLKGDRKGFWSVKVTGNWRVIFRFDREPRDVDLVDYH